MGDKETGNGVSKPTESVQIMLTPPVVQITECSDEPAKSPALRTRKTGDTTSIPRRLSKLFFPPNKDEIKNGKLGDDLQDSTGLISGSIQDIRHLSLTPSSPSFNHQRRKSDLGRLTVPSIKALIRRRSTDAHLDKPDELSKLEEGKNDSKESSSSSSSSSDESETNVDEDLGKEYTSWDDTICSNRSAYFKLYYQGNLTNLKSLDRSRNPTRTSSYNSLASLIKEKDKMKTSPKDKKKKREEIGLMLLVIFLFLILVLGISLIYYFYHQHLEELSLFKRLKFNEDIRELELTDRNGKLVVLSKLGYTLPKYSKPENCYEYLLYEQNKVKNDPQHSITSFTQADISQDIEINKFQFDNETVCLDWANQARLQIHRAVRRDQVNCYNVYWLAHHPGALKDCIFISGSDVGVWWGIGEVSGGGYPLERKILPETVYDTQKLSRGKWGKILRRTFLSSNGGLVILNNNFPAILSIENNTQLCVGVNVSQQAIPEIPTTLNYTICSSPNVSSVLNYLHHLRAGDYSYSVNTELATWNNNQSDIENEIIRRIESAVWIPYQDPNNQSLTQDLVIRYAEKIINLNYSQEGYILLPLSWQGTLGELTFDPIRFPDPKNMTDWLNKHNLYLAVTLSPVISTDAPAFDNGTKTGMWVQQRDSSLPILIPYEGIIAGALIDFTNPKASEWFTDRIKTLQENFGIRHFHLTFPDAEMLPRHRDFHSGISNSDLSIKYYIRSISAVFPPLSTDAALSPPSPPTFVVLGNEGSGWASLSSMIPRILSLSMLGFPLVDSGIVGGTPNRPGNIPDEELFIRWIQATVFLPAFQVNVLPEKFSNDTRSIIADCIKKRRELVLPRFRRSINNVFLNSTPLIAPLGLHYPDDLEADAVKDQWIVGYDLLVAPILEKGQTARDIYIPEGIWETLSDRSLKQGPNWIRYYKVPLTDVPLFLKKRVD